MPKSISLAYVPGMPGSVYYPLSVNEVPKPAPSGNELLIKMLAAGLNHRDLFARQGLYPSLSFETPLLADGCGLVVKTGPTANQSWLGRRVIINPGKGWRDSIEGPEEEGLYKVMGGTKLNSHGTLQEWLCIEDTEVEEVPSHLSDTEAAALPLAGLTAWRAVMVKCGKNNLAAGKNILITGIGGGVALMALMFATATGANVWVTSSTNDKILFAKQIGAKGGVNYKDPDWVGRLIALLPSQNKHIDAIVDGAGGDIIEKTTRLLKHGGIVSAYGMTVSPQLSFSMRSIMRNIELRGSTMGSRKEFADMVRFVEDRNLVPIISKTVKGIENLEGIEELFESMKAGKQLGKLVIEVTGPSAAPKNLSKL